MPCPRRAGTGRDLLLSCSPAGPATLAGEGPSRRGWAVDARGAAKDAAASLHEGLLDVEGTRRRVDGEQTGREERHSGQRCEVHLAPAGRLAPSSRSHRQPGEPEHRTLDDLAQSGTRCLGSVYYRASCPACGQPAVWHDEAVGQLPGLALVRTTSEVVVCTTCDGRTR